VSSGYSGQPHYPDCWGDSSMERLLALIAGVLLFLAEAYALGYSVMGWIVKPLEEAAESEDEDESVAEVCIEGEEEEEERPGDS
jgi:hypothetical protein